MPQTISREALAGFDCIIVGAGFAGAVAARSLADAGQRVLILEKRAHAGGNAYDLYNQDGVLVHLYGPHIFHTDREEVFAFLSRFTEWRPYEHRVLGNIFGLNKPIPFNLRALRESFPPEEAARMQEALLVDYGYGARVPIARLRENERAEIRRLAEYVFETVFVGYTQKQWGIPAADIDPAVTGRVPVLISEDDRYFQNRYQGMPAEGYSALFTRMLTHPGIVLRLGVDALTLFSVDDAGRLLCGGEPWTGRLLYTGALDELFACRYGRLPYRSLDFAFETLLCERFQPAGTVNYTVSEDFTRITEFKYLTGQALPDRTTILREYPTAYTGTPGQIPYYPIVSAEAAALYARYREAAEAIPNLFLSGRLALYKYYDMDAICAEALALSGRLAEGENVR